MKYLLLILTFLLASCGFRPLHQAVTPVTGADAASPLRAVAVDTSFSDDAEDKRAAFMVAQSLRDRIGEPSLAQYDLMITPRVTRSGLAVGRDDVASRFDLNIFTTYVLTSRKDGSEVTRGRVYSVATFGAPIDPYGRITAEVNATEQASEQAADRILTDLAVHFSRSTPAVSGAATPSTP